MKSFDTEEEAIEFIRQHVHEEYGIYFPESRTYSLESKLTKRITTLDLDGITDYANYLQGNPDEVPDLLNVITTNKTHFFREPEHWRFMEDEFIPEVDGQQKIQIWSGACSSGEEPYTAAILIEEARRQGSLSTDYRILATDISQEVLKIGARGTYANKNLDKVRTYDPEFEETYFNRTNQNNASVHPSLKQQVYFRQFNLKFNSNPFTKQFDLIMLRNVWIYFDEPMMQNLIDHVKNLLRPGGYLYIGHTENINSLDHGLERVQPSIYRLPERVQTR